MAAPTTSADVRPSDGKAPTLAVTQMRVVKAEWIKLRSVRSSMIGLGAAVAIAVGLGLLFSSFAGAGPAEGGGPPNAATDPLAISLSGFNLSQLIIGVLGVSLVTGEYSTGLMSTMFSAVARRLPVLRAKVIVFGGTTLVLMVVAALAAAIGGQALYSGDETAVSLSDPDVVRAVLGAAVYATGVGLLGIAIGFLLRTTAAGIGVLFATLLLIPGLSGLLPDAVGAPLTKLLPTNAGEAFTSVTNDPDLLSPAVGFVVFALWVVGLLGAACLVVKRRDA